MRQIVRERRSTDVCELGRARRARAEVSGAVLADSDNYPAPSLIVVHRGELPERGRTRAFSLCVPPMKYQRVISPSIRADAVAVNQVNFLALLGQ